MPLPTPSQLSRELRLGDDPHLNRRRWIVGLSYLSAGAGIIVSLYQMGILRRLPDLPFWRFNATEVDKSDYAYKRMQTPDGLLMVATYALTAILAGAGGRRRTKDLPLVPIMMAAKTVYDAGLAVKLGTEEWREKRLLCGYCQTATIASLITVALAMPEAIDAARNLRRRVRG